LLFLYYYRVINTYYLGIDLDQYSVKNIEYFQYLNLSKQHMDNRIIYIKDRLEREIKADSVKVEDQGHLHKGHKAHDEGKMHIWVEIVSNDFLNMSPIQRHQLVYGILGEELKGDLHAISLSLMTSEEKSEMNGEVK